MEKTKQIKTNKEYRLKNIMNAAEDASNMSIFRFWEIKSILRSISVLSNTKLLNTINSAIKNINNGNFVTEKEFLNE